MAIREGEVATTSTTTASTCHRRDIAVAEEGPLMSIIASKSDDNHHEGKDKQPQQQEDEAEGGNDQEQPVSVMTVDWSTLMMSGSSSTAGGGKLYDREVEQERLLDRFRRIIDENERELVLITGPSGNGKTALAKKTLRRPVAVRGGYFLSGKFDQLQRPETSFGAFVQAFTKYVRYVIMDEEKAHDNMDASETEVSTTAELESDGTILVDAPLTSKAESVRRKVIAAIGVEGQQLLMQMIPALRELLGGGRSGGVDGGGTRNSNTASEDTTLNLSSQQNRRDGKTSNNSNICGFEVQKRFQFVFKTFVKTICSRQSPIVLFIDDLQWANKESIDLLAALLTDDSIEGFMVLGACRGNEVALDDELSVMLRHLETTQELTICDIQVGCLKVEAVQALLSDLFDLPLEQCASLAKTIHDHTEGNPFSLLQFIRSLSEKGIVKLTEAGVRVDYSGLDAFWASTGAKAGIVGLLCNKIQQLPPPLQEFLQVAACLGAEFDRTVIERIVETDCTEWMLMGQDVGFVTPAAAATQESQSSTQCFFVHDRVQQAAYSLIADKPTFHLHLCRRLWISYAATGTNNELLEHSPLVVNQLCHGYQLIDDEEERLNAAKLCLHAGKLSMQASSFRTAATYFEVGRHLLGNQNWRNHYNLSISLFSLSAEVEYAIGNPKGSSELVDQIIANARIMRDKIQAYCTRIYSLGSRHELQEAMAVSMSVLRELQEPLPRNGGLRHVVLDFIKTTIMLRGKSDESILRMRWMGDANKMAAMRVLNVVFVYFFISKPLLAPLLAMRMVQITLRHGLCALSGFGVACYGLLLCNLGMVDEGCRFADLGMELQKRYGGEEWVARVYLMSYLFTYASKYPVRDSIGPLLFAYRTGLMTGDTEFGCFGAQFAGHSAVYSSQPLQRTYDDMKVYRSSFVAYKQNLVLAYHDVILQLVANLLGKARNPAILEGKYVAFEKALRFAKEEGHISLQYELYGFGAIVAYFANDLDRAEAMIGPLKRLDEKVVMVMAVRIATFFEALCLIRLAEKTNNLLRRAYLLGGAKLIQRKFRRASRSSPENCLKNALILEAELDVVWQGKLESGLTKFEKAIVEAGKEEALMEQGIACEGAAKVLRKMGRISESKDYLELALSSYSKWGCQVKIDQLKQIQSRDLE